MLERNFHQQPFPSQKTRGDLSMFIVIAVKQFREEFWCVWQFHMAGNWNGKKKHFDVKAVPLVILKIQGMKDCVPQQMVTYCMCCYSYFCYILCVHAGWSSLIDWELFFALFFFPSSPVQFSNYTECRNLFLHCLLCTSSAKDSDEFFLKQPGIWKVTFTNMKLTGKKSSKCSLQMFWVQ